MAFLQSGKKPVQRGCALRFARVKVKAVFVILLLGNLIFARNWCLDRYNIIMISVSYKSEPGNDDNISSKSFNIIGSTTYFQ